VLRTSFSGQRRHFIALLKQKENAEVVKAEIQSIQGKYGRWTQEPKLPKHPCPFTASLLGTAWCADKGEEDPEGQPYISGIAFTWSALPADIGLWDCDNDDGISIIDITEPESPAYCFIQSEQRRRPLDAQGYMSDYGHVPTNDRRLERSLQALASIPLVTQDMLDEAWPEQDRNEADTNPADAGVVTIIAGTDEPQVMADTFIPSLAQMSLVPALDQAISSGDTSNIERLLSQPDKAQQIRSYLRNQKPFPSNAVSLLEALVADEQSESIDLSGFDLSTDRLLQVLSSRKNTVHALNLSGNECITSETVAQLLTTLSSLRRLVLIGCPSIKEADLFDLLRNKPELFYNLNTLLHPSLLDVYEPPRWPVAFTFVCTSQATMAPRMRGCCFPVFTPTSIMQSLLDLVEIAARSPPVHVSSNGGMAAQAVFSATRKPGQPFSERTLAAAPLFGLDAFAVGSHPSWTCIYQWGDLLAPTGGQYTFIRYRSFDNTDNKDDAKGQHTNEDRLPVERYDMPGFLAALKSEGRPPVSDALVTKLSQYLLCKEETERRSAEAPKQTRVLVPDLVGTPEEQMLQMYAQGLETERQMLHVREDKTVAFMSDDQVKRVMGTMAISNMEYRLFGHWGDSK